MILHSDGNGRIIRIRDVAHSELGALGYDQVCTLDGKPLVAPFGVPASRIERGWKRHNLVRQTEDGGAEKSLSRRGRLFDRL